MSDLGQSGTYDSKTEAVAGGDTAFAKLWIDALNLSETEEKEWVKEAERAFKVYRGDKGSSGRAFNIFHSNVETISPALYNSTPAPDVRRRYNDDDPAGKVTADIIDRSLSFSIESYDFDAVMKAVIRDGEIVGRGVPRVRYVPTFGGDLKKDDGTAEEDGNGQPLRELVYEAVTCDYVPWRYFRRGPGRTWADIPWVAYGDFLNQDELKKLCPTISDKIPRNYTGGATQDKKSPGSEEQSIYKRALVWQIWDRESRKVISICTDYSQSALATIDDPLGLTHFFPTPRPYQPINATDSLVPIIPYTIYEDLVTELNEVTERISRLVRQCRMRGLYAGNDANDIAAWASADDGQLVPATNIQAMLGEGSMQQAIAWFPIEAAVAALSHLITQRDMVKQTIYEVTGMSDIMRGASHASETATAQNIKAQWGSLRIQDRQAEVARVARDLLRLKAEIICGKFSWDTLSQMTAITAPPQEQRDQAKQMVAQYKQAVAQAQQPPQPGQPPSPPPPPLPPNADEIEEMAEGPSREEVEQILRSDVMLAYRIDIESDSTIRGDLTRNQQTMNTFLQGTAQFSAAMGPIIQEFPKATPAIMTIFSAFARHFKLGKQAEDALDKLAEDIAEDSATAGPKPDPKMDAIKAKSAADQQKAMLDMQAQQMDMKAKQAEHAMKLQELQAKNDAAQTNLAIDQQSAQNKAAHDANKLNLDAQRLELKRQNLALDAMSTPPDPYMQAAQQMAPAQ